MIETSKIIQALCYLLIKLKMADKIKLIKLLYLADKYHLIRYGRTVTNDEYWAMELGPVGTTAKDILGFDKDFLRYEYKYASKLLEKVDNHRFKPGTSCSKTSLDMLSETDIEALDFVLEKFGKKNKWALMKYTHQYPEWKKYETLFEKGMTKRILLETEELLSFIGDDGFEMPDEHIEESRRILTGTFD